ncbi:PilZ domain-containing protein [Pelagibius sp. CAU 1746]|uniref:PilZ domain-containing protein n=1 Tax=Pelagibius sp. CAU 1746 TaxID=3140370 RepID=UPI00325ACD66
MNRNGMKVMRKERRRDRRRGLNLEATLGGHEVVLTDLSAAGFGAALDATDRTPFSFRLGAQSRLELKAPQGAPLSLSVEIVREMGDNGVVGGVFIGLTDAAYNAIEGILTGRSQRRG